MNNAFLLDMSQRIGWTLVHSIWQFALIAMLLALGPRLVRGCSSHLRYGFMLAALCVLAVMPVGTFLVLKSAALPSREFIVSVPVDAKLSSAVQRLDLELVTGRELTGAVLVLDSPDGSSRSANMATGSRAMGSILSNITAMTQRTIEQWMNGILAVWLFGV